MSVARHAVYSAKHSFVFIKIIQILVVIDCDVRFTYINALDIFVRGNVEKHDELQALIRFPNAEYFALSYY